MANIVGGEARRLAGRGEALDEVEHSGFLVDDWVGRRAFAELGIGYEWYSSRLSDEGVESIRRYRGALRSTRAGIDFGLGKQFSLGPVLDIGIGEFSHSSFEAPGIDRGGRVDGSAVHGWLAVGVRAAFEP